MAWPIILAAIIFAASSRAAATAPEGEGIDKVVHFAIYGLLATLVCRLGAGWTAAVCAFLVAAGYGALDEWHQSFVPERASELADWMADAAGAAVAVLLYAGWPRYRRWLETPMGTRVKRIRKP